MPKTETSPLHMAPPDFAFRQQPLRKIVFGSCHKNKYADATVWQQIANEQPDVFVWTGDAVYPPVRGIASSKELSQEYDQLLHNATIGYQSFVQKQQPNLQIFGVYDDHDYGGNDRGRHMPDRTTRAQLFWNFLNASRPAVAQRHGLYYSVAWSNARLIVLDTRWHRQDHCIPSAAATRLPLGAGLACLSRWFTAGLYPWCRQEPDAMLGTEQWRWLQGQLQRVEKLPTEGDDEEEEEQHAQPPLDIIVSSVQVLTTNPAMERYVTVC